MGYRQQGSLVDLFDVSSVERTARNIVERVGDYTHDRVVRHTPVAKPPPGVDFDDWLDARGDRKPGELKRSWRVGEVEAYNAVTGERMKIDVYTLDPVAPDVEWDTQPHIIVPKDPDGFLRFWSQRGDIVFAKIVRHPGTKGVHMMATALAETAAAWHAIAADEVAKWAAMHFRGGPPAYASRWRGNISGT